MTANTAAGDLAGEPATTTDVEDPAPEEAQGDDRRRRQRLVLLFVLMGLLAVLAALTLWYLLFRKPLPLPDIPAFRMPSYTTSIHGAQAAFGIAVTPTGDRIYVAQTEGDRSVAVLDLAGNLVGLAVPPAATGTDHVPVWVAVNSVTSEVYVTDRPTGSIYVYDRDGAYLRTFAPLERIAGWQPVGIAFDSAGNLYVTDLGGTEVRVEEFDPTGALVRTIGEGENLSFANGVAVDADGIVYVADSNNGRLLSFGTDGALLGQVGRGFGPTELGLPRGLSVDEKGWIYVCDSTSQGINVFRAKDGDPSRLEHIGFFGGEGASEGHFSFPNGVATDARGRVYVTDTGNDRIQIWSY